MRSFLVLVFAVVVVSIPINIPDPSDLTIYLNEDDFEDYLDLWLKLKYQNISQINQRNAGCTIQINGDLGQPQPVYIHDNNYLTPTGNTGQIHLKTGEEVTIACVGSGQNIVHPSVTSSTNIGIATCVNDTIISGKGWIDGVGAFGDLACSSHCTHEALLTSEKCYNNNVVIRVGFTVNNVFYPLYWSCFDQNRLEVLYVWYEQNPPNAVHQVGVIRPSWKAGNFYPGIDVNNRYTVAQQKVTISNYLGTDLAEKYVTSTQYLARGHLAAKTDFIYATGQRATFYFINCAPQWQLFNGGNWNLLEQNLRTRIGEAGYNTVVYTGTYGVLQLKDSNNQLVDIYLHQDSNNHTQLPVPLYYYKVVYDQAKRLGTAFVGINNPYITLEEARSLQFCNDHCRSNSSFTWLGWQPDRVDRGYSFCCSIEDFKTVVPHLPNFIVNDLLT
ncbi:uncharacterized protein LOC106721566 [Papilio machaon]|uniref:uncharacterized protein LOC106721566 n=1 Tax=Papilio machaon TaxID=76193 RepID=UPI001E6653BA|nr:uncharacterized protein LOC106721566 [Papilio machaon]